MRIEDWILSQQRRESGACLRQTGRPLLELYFPDESCAKGKWSVFTEGE